MHSSRKHHGLVVPAFCGDKNLLSPQFSSRVFNYIGHFAGIAGIVSNAYGYGKKFFTQAPAARIMCVGTAQRWILSPLSPQILVSRSKQVLKSAGTGPAYPRKSLEVSCYSL